MANMNQSDTEEEAKAKLEGIECAVCLQTAVYPVQLPCSHVFCFLCVKGFTTQSKRCAMCRREVPEDYLLHPALLDRHTDLRAVTERGFDDEAGGCWQWLYEGRNGWWLYDERTSQEVERCFNNGDQRCELLIAGFLYIIGKSGCTVENALRFKIKFLQILNTCYSIDGMIQVEGGGSREMWLQHQRKGLQA